MSDYRMSMITPYQLRDKLKSQDKITLIDIREPEEFEICHIDGSILVPLSEFGEHVNDFDNEKEYVIICKEGKITEKAASIMAENGFLNLKGLDGGIMNWANSIERTMEKY
jgi:rhodanese-related sulfurtransferase